jgi:hypothetical protein
MGSKERRLSYSIAFQVEVVNCAVKHENRAAERCFGSPPTEKMIGEWRKQKKDLIKADKCKKKLYVYVILNGQNFKNMLKSGIIDHRKKGVAVSTKIILIETRRPATETSITDFVGTTCGVKDL